VYRVSDFPRFEFRVTASGKLIRQLHFGVYDKILSLALSPDGHIIALTVYNRKNKASQIILCNVVDGKELQAIPTADTSTVLAFSPDSQLLISGNIGGFRLWGNDVNTDVSSAS
jgi:Tol biopolymer transport system component